MVLQGLAPERVFYWFEKICSIPHGSGNTKAISDFCVAFARDNGLAVKQDKHNNVVISKPASQGKESHPTVILQGHLDMVCEKDEGVDFDFVTQGIRLLRDGDIVTADGTTLGGDNGIAVAISMAILEDKTLCHGPLQALFTVDEEIGLLGAAALDGSLLNGSTLINVDSEVEGILTVGCAGGVSVELALEMIPTALSAPCYQIEIGGLDGGHSGVEIDKGRHNAIKLMGELLCQLEEPCLISIDGGKKDNVIPSFVRACVSTASDLFALAKRMENEYRDDNNSGLEITVTPLEETLGYDSFSSKAALTLLSQLPCGVQKWSEDIEGLVQTSMNVGVIGIKDDILHITLSIRSSVDAEKQALVEKVIAIGNLHGAAAKVSGDYPGWAYRKDSPLRDTMIAVFERLYGKAPTVEMIHAGLECGVLGEKIENIDAVSIGPQMWDIHSTRERLSISSVERTYRYICEILKEL